MIRFRKTLAVILAASMVLSGNISAVYAQEIADAADVISDVDISEEAVITDDGVISETTSEESGNDDAALIDEQAGIEEVLSPELGSSIDETAEESAENEVVSGNLTDDAEAADQDTAVETVGATGDYTFSIEGAGATFTKKNAVTISWKKNKALKTYNLYRLVLSSNGVYCAAEQPFATGVKKNSYVDSSYTSSEVFGYKIVGCDAYGSEQESYYAYVLCAPAIATVQRDSDVNSSSTKMDVSVINDSAITTSSNSTSSNYVITLYSGTSKKDASFSKTGIRKISSTSKSGLYNKKSVQLRDLVVTVPGENAKTVYYFKAQSSIQVYDSYKNRTTSITSKYSAIQSGKVTVRAPREGAVVEKNGQTAYISWEDMTCSESNNDDDGSESVSDNSALTTVSGNHVSAFDRLSESDYYVIYASIDGGKYKKLKQVNMDDLVDISANTVYKTYGLPVKTFDTVAYELEGLKAEKNYKFAIQAVKSKKAGVKSEEGNLSVYTELTRVTGVSANTNIDSMTVSWNAVAGTTKYRIYYTAALGKTNPGKAFPGKNDYSTDLVISAKPDKNGIAKYTIKKLKNLNYYGVKVIALGHKSANEGCSDVQADPDNDSADNCTYGFTKIAAPVVKVTQKKNKLYFTWKSVKKATGYHIQCEKAVYNQVKGDYTFNLIEDEDLSVKKLSWTTDELEVGQRYRIRVYSMYETDGITGTDKYGNYSELDEALAPEIATINGTFYNGSDSSLLGAKISYTQPSSSYIATGTSITYDVYRSYKKNKNFQQVDSSYITCAGGYIYDNSVLNDGKKAYYRIYTVASSPKYGNFSVKSRTYATAEYCKPTTVTASNVKVAAGSTAEVSLTFKPTGTTMKEVTKWYVAEGEDDDDFLDNPVTFNDGKASNYASNSYFAVTKGTKYDKNISNWSSGPYSPTLTIKGVKKGTSYLKAVLANGDSVIVKIIVGAKSSDSSSSPSSSGKVVVLDPGHGGSDAGCSSGSLYEKTINLKISKYTKSYLKDKGYTVYITRDDDSKVDLDDRVDYAVKKNADLLVSQHINSGGGNGVECWYSLYYESGNAKKIAQSLCDKTVAKTSLSSRGVKTKKGSSGSSDYYAINRYSANNNLIGLIMENGFIDGDYTFLSSDSNLDKIAEGNANGIAAADDYF